MSDETVERYVEAKKDLEALTAEIETDIGEIGNLHTLLSGNGWKTREFREGQPLLTRPLCREVGLSLIQIVPGSTRIGLSASTPSSRRSSDGGK